MRVSFQGEPGAYSHEALLAAFKNAEAVPCKTFDSALAAAEKGEAELAFLPIENSTEGSVGRVNDLLLKTELKIMAEYSHRIVHCLIACPGVKMWDVKRAYSHPQALGQCALFLEKRGIEPVAHYDTAGAVRFVRDGNLRDAAAIASENAAKIHKMEILQISIEDSRNNLTRFLALGNDELAMTGVDKTMIAFSLRHEPGALFRALRPFAERGINLTRIESRPTKDRPWEYYFFLDFSGHRSEEKCAAALEELRGGCLFLKILGAFPRGD